MATTRREYRITKWDSSELLCTVRAQSYEHAALAAARKLYGRRYGAIRVTGESGKSGCFRTTEHVAGGLSCGQTYHVA